VRLCFLLFLYRRLVNCKTMTNFTRISKAAGAVFGAAGLAGIGAAAMLRRSLPRTAGTLRLAGLHAPVEVLRDRWGVPHIYAGSVHDLFMAQGYVHAQDRLWQMEFQRRLARGQLAEILGEIALPSDRLMRILGFSRIAQREAELLDRATYADVAAYVHGVNVFIEQHARRLPLEFAVLRFRPRAWQVSDVLVWAKIMALNLSENWTMEMLRARIVAAVGPQRAAALDPLYRDDHPLTIPAGARYHAALGEDALRMADDAAPFTGSGDMAQGSNAWVVGGRRTASGKPLLANDPHLALQMPSLWYENHLHGGDIHVTGASLVGAPGVIIGHNERIAWGVTNGLNDVQDVYIEHFDSHNPTRYMFQGEWQQAEIVREEIRVKGRAEPFVEEVRVTRHGPVISPLVETNDERRTTAASRWQSAGGSEPLATGDWRLATGDQHPATVEGLALRWTALEPGTITKAVLGVNRAADWHSFRAALADWTVPPQNFVYADVDGHFGYTLGGAIPVRANGDGRLPVPGWTSEYEWTGFIPNDELPHDLDPQAGFAVTANNKIVGDEYPHRLHAEWLPGYRAARIREMIEQTDRHDQTSFARMHADLRSLPGLELAALAGRLPAYDVVTQHARDALAAWDGNLTVESAGGLIYARLREKLMAVAFSEISGPLGKIAGLGALAVLPGMGFLNRALPGTLRRIARRDDAWLPGEQTWDAVLGEAWRAALAELRREFGDDVRAWQYGRTHKLTLRHPLGAVPGLAKLLNRGPFSTGGDIDTVFMGYAPRRFAGVPFYVAPSYRQVCDTSNWDHSRSIHPTGQSGQPGSRHYADFPQAWLDVDYHPMPWSRVFVEEVSAGRLLLQP
jgi:penicillin amidase